MFDSFNVTRSSCAATVNDDLQRKFLKGSQGVGAFVEANYTAIGGSSNSALEPSDADYESINDSFPFKLHIMLSEIDDQGLAHIVSWQPHGKCFIVHDRQQFVKQIMPTFFRMTKFESFQRQLNLYGFNRITVGRDKGGYYHEFFVRNQRHLCSEIQRYKVKGTVVRKPAARENEPNFYKLPGAIVNNDTNVSNAGMNPPSSADELPCQEHPNVVAFPDPGTTLPTFPMDQSLIMAKPMTACNHSQNLCLTSAVGGVASGMGGNQAESQQLGVLSAGHLLCVDPFRDISVQESSCGWSSPAMSGSNANEKNQVLDDLDKSFEALMTALRALDETYLLTLRTGMS